MQIPWNDIGADIDRQSLAKLNDNPEQAKTLKTLLEFVSAKETSTARSLAPALSKGVPSNSAAQAPPNIDGKEPPAPPEQRPPVVSIDSDSENHEITILNGV